MIEMFFDTETTDMLNFKRPLTDPSQPGLVQIAWELWENGNLIAEHDHTIHPYGFKISAGAMKAHGITEAYATEFGEPLDEVMPQFFKDAARATKLIAHNAPFDWKITEICRLREFPKHLRIPENKCACTMRAATDICRVPSNRGGKGYKWPTLMEAYQILVDPAGFENAHDALADVRACRAIYYALKAKGIRI